MTHREAVIEAVSQLSDELLAYIVEDSYEVCQKAYELLNGSSCKKCGEHCYDCAMRNVYTTARWLKEDSNAAGRSGATRDMMREYLAEVHG